MHSGRPRRDVGRVWRSQQRQPSVQLHVDHLQSVPVGRHLERSTLRRVVHSVVQPPERLHGGGAVRRQHSGRPESRRRRRRPEVMRRDFCHRSTDWSRRSSGVRANRFRPRWRFGRRIGRRSDDRCRNSTRWRCKKSTEKRVATKGNCLSDFKENPASRRQRIEQRIENVEAATTMPDGEISRKRRFTRPRNRKAHESKKRRKKAESSKESAAHRRCNREDQSFET